MVVHRELDTYMLIDLPFTVMVVVPECCFWKATNSDTHSSSVFSATMPVDDMLQKKLSVRVTLRRSRNSYSPILQVKLSYSESM